MLPPVYPWNKAPFIRLLPPLIAGILFQWHCRLDVRWLLILFSASMACILLYFLLPVYKRFNNRLTGGLLQNLVLIFFGGLLVFREDIRNSRQWIGHFSTDSCTTAVVLEEDAVEKRASFKVVAGIMGIYRKGLPVKVQGKAILYFQKDSSLLPHLKYGKVLLFKKALKPISNSGNPGSFDFARYSLFHGISHQSFLARHEFIEYPSVPGHDLSSVLIACRQWIIGTLKKNLPGKKEQGLAEALLIGYKDDLDKDLVQAYSDTGVVHVIAISGLHLGLIYWLLLMLTRPLTSHRSGLVRFLLICSGLWTFSLLAGAQPSVLRSAVMFCFLAAGTAFSRPTSVYNTLALSAFALLCYNPFWLWDAGFQLSYSAVLSIIVFYRPVYNLFYVPNFLLNSVWKLAAVTLSAQLFTLPFCLYHFHQFPLLFLFTNLVAVPLSSFILIGELLVCCLFFFPTLSRLAGQFFSWCIWLMNTYVERMNRFPYSVLEGLYITTGQGILLLLTVAFTGHWLINRQNKAAALALLSLFFFSCLRLHFFVKASSGCAIIVYQVPRMTVLEVHSGRTAYFLGDSALLQNKALYRFHLQPSHTLNRIRETNIVPGKLLTIEGKKLRLLDSTAAQAGREKDPVDLLVLAGNIKTSFPRLIQTFKPCQVVISSSVPAWRAATWKRQADSLHIPCHNVVEKGAFVVKPGALPLRPR